LRMPIALAIGTSLLIILVNSVSARVSRLAVAHVDWQVVAPFMVAAVAGTFAGNWVADKLSGPVLTRSFAVMLALVGGLVGARSLLAV
jgi:uncharacterized membrane protein YfcA